MTTILITLLKRDLGTVRQNPRLVMLPALVFITSLYLVCFFAPDLTAAHTKIIYVTLLFLMIATQDNQFSLDQKRGVLDHFIVYGLSQGAYFWSRLIALSSVWILIACISYLSLFGTAPISEWCKVSLFVIGTNTLVLIIHRIFLAMTHLGALIMVMIMPLVLPLFMLVLHADYYHASMGISLYIVFLLFIYGAMTMYQKKLS